MPPRLLKNRIALEQARLSRLIDLSPFLVQSRGKVLRHLSFLKANDLLDGAIMYSRTGVSTMADTGRIMITWKNIAKACGLTDDPMKWTGVEKKEMLAYVGRHLEDFTNPNRPFRGAVVEPLDEETKKKLTKLLHQVMQKRGNVLKIDAVSAFIVALSEEDEDLDEVRDSLRKLAKLEPSSWSIGGGGSPDLIRLKDQRGKETGEEAAAPRAARGSAQNGASSSGKAYQRFMSSAFQGYTKRDFEDAKRALKKDAISPGELAQFKDRQHN